MDTEFPAGPIEHIISARTRDLGGFSVGRVLPSPQRRLIGPFIFFDHMGPHQFEPGTGINVRPHPHIGLATVTYLFDGEIFHRDSLGSAQAIRPGDVNWMIAGRGIVHSERTAPERRDNGQALHGIQAWIAYPSELEGVAPSFHHHPKSTLPAQDRPGVKLRVIAGTAYGLASPVVVASPTFYVDALLEPGASLELPNEHEERGFYVAQGSVKVGEQDYAARNLAVLRPGEPVTIAATSAARVMLLGGAKLAGERFIEWNFVASSQGRIDQAKLDWQARRFPSVPGDEVEFIPLPPSRV